MLNCNLYILIQYKLLQYKVYSIHKMIGSPMITGTIGLPIIGTNIHWSTPHCMLRNI